MTQHFTKLTVSAAFWCGKCEKQTQHRIDGGRKGPCLDCIARLDALHAAKPNSLPPQISLFEEIA